MKCLVTGSAGFIGSHLVDRLLDLGHTVIGVDNLSNGNYIPKHENFKFFKKDIRDDLTEVFHKNAITIIFHLAALGGVPRSLKEPGLYFDVNVNGTRNIIEYARRHLFATKIIFASSSSVYGNANHFPQKEGKEGTPLSPYAYTKALCEYMLDISRMNYIALRFFNIYGPRQKPIAVIPRWITQQRATIFGNGTNSRDFTYVSNAVDALMCAISTRRNGIYNIAMGSPINLENLADILRLEKQYYPEREGDIKRSHAEIRAAKYYLNWKPKVSLIDGLNETINWYREVNSCI